VQREDRLEDQDPAVPSRRGAGHAPTDWANWRDDLSAIKVAAGRVGFHGVLVHEASIRRRRHSVASSFCAPDLVRCARLQISMKPRLKKVTTKGNSDATPAREFCERNFDVEKHSKFNEFPE
jgi:hypothetical protein